MNEETQTPKEIANSILNDINHTATIKELTDSYGGDIIQIDMRPQIYLDMVFGLKQIAKYEHGDTAETTKDARDLHAYFNHATTIYRPEQIHPPSVNPQKYVWIRMEYIAWSRILSKVLQIIRREETQ